jgi:hypothetical protein
MRWVENENTMQLLNVSEKEVEEAIPNFKDYLLDISNQLIKRGKPEALYQRHQAFLQWREKDYKKLDLPLGYAILTRKIVEQIIYKVVQMFPFETTADYMTRTELRPEVARMKYITAVLGGEAITKYIMDKKKCTYYGATGLAQGSIRMLKKPCMERIGKK